MELDNQINLNYIRMFIEAAESNSLQEVADKLGYEISNVSATIKKFEKQLGVQLFYRKHKGSNNGLKITAIGEEIYPQAKKVISSCDFIPLMIDSRNSLENGKLSIGCPSHITVFFLMAKLIELTQDYPNIEIRLDTESNSKTMIQKIKNNEIDFVILDSIPDEYVKELEVKEIKNSKNIKL